MFCSTSRIRRHSLHGNISRNNFWPWKRFPFIVHSEVWIECPYQTILYCDIWLKCFHHIFKVGSIKKFFFLFIMFIIHLFPSHYVSISLITRFHETQNIKILKLFDTGTGTIILKILKLKEQWQWMKSFISWLQWFQYSIFMLLRIQKVKYILCLLGLVYFFLVLVLVYG